MSSSVADPPLARVSGRDQVSGPGDWYAPPLSERTSWCLDRRAEGPEGKWVWLLMLGPLVCCGSPAITALVAPVGALTGGLAIGLSGALAVGVVVTMAWRRRRTTACCAMPRPGRPAAR